MSMSQKAPPGTLAGHRMFHTLWPKPWKMPRTKAASAKNRCALQSVHEIASEVGAARPLITEGPGTLRGTQHALPIAWWTRLLACMLSEHQA